MGRAIKAVGAFLVFYYVVVSATGSQAGQMLRDIMFVYIAFRLIKAIAGWRKRGTAGMREYDRQQRRRTRATRSEDRDYTDGFDRDGFDRDYAYDGSYH
jgi:hypothetical protein